jgi:hypothetical protein
MRMRLQSKRMDRNRPKRRWSNRRFRPAWEPVEDRVLPSVFTVTSTADTTTGGTLRQMIESANSHSGLDIIKFNIPGSGAHTIQLQSALPTITGTLAIASLPRHSASISVIST